MVLYVKVLNTYILAEIKRLSDESSDNVFVCISNETIFGYGGIEINAILLKLVLQELRRSLQKVANLYVTIREQGSFLQSFYAYDYGHQKVYYKNINEFIEYGIRNRENKIFGQLDYFSAHHKLMDIFADNDFT